MSCTHAHAHMCSCTHMLMITQAQAQAHAASWCMISCMVSSRSWLHGFVGSMMSMMVSSWFAALPGPEATTECPLTSAKLEGSGPRTGTRGWLYGGAKGQNKVNELTGKKSECWCTDPTTLALSSTPSTCCTDVRCCDVAY